MTDESITALKMNKSFKQWKAHLDILKEFLEEEDVKNKKETLLLLKRLREDLENFEDYIKLIRNGSIIRYKHITQAIEEIENENTGFAKKEFAKNILWAVGEYVKNKNDE